MKYHGLKQLPVGAKLPGPYDPALSGRMKTGLSSAYLKYYFTSGCSFGMPKSETLQKNLTCIIYIHAKCKYQNRKYTVI